MKTWWIGLLLTIFAEIGNFAAYGDPSTPSSVVASLGCVAVISNTFISAFFLGEGLRTRDIGGVAMVVVGVVLIIIFVPKNQEGGTRNLLPCPIFFSGNWSAHACQVCCASEKPGGTSPAHDAATVRIACSFQTRGQEETRSLRHMCPASTCARCMASWQSVQITGT